MGTLGRLDIRKNVFSGRMVRNWEVVELLSLEVFKECGDLTFRDVVVISWTG